MTTASNFRPAIGQKVLQYIEDDGAWYTLAVKSDLLSPLNGRERVEATYVDYPDDGSITVFVDELYKIPEPLN
ncbi:hypothetical protein D1224_10920 [Henriciella barbarensis]|uniref:Uncharacterized protein n=1 Tax=Henriciella barbarensis TaxID=86342 RepID=A0A399QT09_9PROT|nr:hypothetical protein [Henriciella barbarensis]RIJ22076.1 hypothetical protein D1224_10920 [Henriciella barbarensis]